MSSKVLRFPSPVAPEAPASEYTREEFLAEPWRCLRSSTVEVLPAWIGEAWSQRTFRKHATDALVRSVKQNGDLFAASDLLVALGGAGLRREAVIELFVAIRDHVEVTESDWRVDFEGAFPDHAASLPPRL